MIILDYKKQHHKKIIDACVLALKKGKIVAYPTDTSYGLAADAENIRAVKKLYRIKGRDFNKPIHLVVPGMAYAKKIAQWDIAASKLAGKFFPGPLTLVLPLRTNNFLSAEALAKAEALRALSAKTGFIGIRMPKNQIALDLAKYLKKPITATSANISGESDCYSAAEIVSQFSAGGASASGGKNKKHKPDIIIDAGKLANRKPSTVVKIYNNKIQILREGPVSKKQIIAIIAKIDGRQF